MIMYIIDVGKIRCIELKKKRHVWKCSYKIVKRYLNVESNEKYKQNVGKGSKVC